MGSIKLSFDMIMWLYNYHFSVWNLILDVTVGNDASYPSVPTMTDKAILTLSGISKSSWRNRNFGHIRIKKLIGIANVHVNGQHQCRASTSNVNDHNND